MPVRALTRVVLPWSMWPAVPMIMASGCLEEGGVGQGDVVGEYRVGAPPLPIAATAIACP